jgi:hypothetical protein
MSSEARFAIRDRDNLRHQNKRLQDRVAYLEEAERIGIREQARLIQERDHWQDQWAKAIAR